MVEEDDGTSGQLMEGLVKNKGSGKPLTGFRQGSDARFSLWSNGFGCSVESQLERSKNGSRGLR